MTRITGAIIAKDEAAHIGACLDSLKWADETLVVLDTRSSDATAEIAAARGARVVSNRFTTFPAQRNFALEHIQTDWVLFVDADERVDAALAAEVRAVIESDAADSPVGYWVPRRNIIWGKWILGGGWYPDCQLRLLRVGRARYDEAKEVHEVVVLDGAQATLANAFTHYNYRTISQFVAKQCVYSTLDAQTMRAKGIRPKPQNYVLQPLREFRRRFVEHRGYLDGPHGFLLASLLAWFNLVTYLKLTRLGLPGGRAGS
jgi:glycosyltransferase involved in cell wall biosynthesis